MTLEFKQHRNQYVGILKEYKNFLNVSHSEKYLKTSKDEIKPYFFN